MADLTENLEAVNFTWFGKMTKSILRMPDEKQAEFVIAVIKYGTFGIDPEFNDWTLESTFEMFKDDIDHSVKSRTSGKAGGKSKGKNKVGLNPPSNPPSSVDNYPSNPPSNPIQNNTNHKKEINKEKKSETKSDTSKIHCSFCGAPVENRTIYSDGSPKQILVCHKGHTCDEFGNAKNHQGGNDA